jgi:arylsulfate sulfotransferase
MKTRKAIFAIAGPLIFAFISCSKTTETRSLPVAPLTQNVYTVTESGTPSKGQILVAPFLLNVVDSGQLIIMDQDGKVLKEKSLPGATLCFNKWVINGETRYTYIVNDVNAYHIPIVGNFAGYIVIADSNLNEIKRVNLLPNNGIITSDGHSADVHDFILLSDDHYILEAYYDKHADNIPAYLKPSAKNKIVANIIQEIDKGAVIWQWDGSQDTSFYANSVLFNNYQDTVQPQDYMHLNSMVIDPRDNNLICSFRHQCQIVKLNRQSGAVIWRLGGKNGTIPLSSDQSFIYEHDATLTDSNSTLLVYDNGDPVLRPKTRILEFKLDEANKAVTGFKAFDVPENFTDLMGSVQKYGDTYFIGGGTSNYVLEINSVTSEKITEFAGTKTTYRAYKYP